MKVFVSVIDEEAGLAEVLKDWVEIAFLGQVDVFESFPVGVGPDSNLDR